MAIQTVYGKTVQVGSHKPQYDREWGGWYDFGTAGSNYFGYDDTGSRVRNLWGAICFTTYTLTGPTNSREIDFRAFYQSWVRNMEVDVQWILSFKNPRLEGNNPPTGSDILNSGTFHLPKLTNDGYFHTQTIKVPNLQSNKEHFIWLKPTGTGKMKIRSNKDGHVLYRFNSMTPCLPPKNLKIDNSTGAVYKIPSSKVRLSWDAGAGGDGNAFKHYYIQQSINDGNWTGVAPTFNTTALYVDINIPATRGQNIRYRVRTEGHAGAEGYSDYLNSGNRAYVNRLPSAPNASVNKTIVKSSGDTVRYTASTAGDPDGQALSLYYSIKGSSAKHLFKSPQDFTATPTNNYDEITFYVWDGLEYGPGRTVKVNFNIKPIIHNIWITSDIKTGILTDSRYGLNKNIKSSAELNKTVSSYNWLVAIGTTASNLNYNAPISWGNSTKYDNWVDFGNIVTRGYFYQIGLQVSDAYESSDIKWHNGLYQMPRIPNGAIISAIKNSITGDNVSGTNLSQFENGVYITYKNPILSGGYGNISSVKPIYRLSNDGVNYQNPVVYDKAGGTGSGAINSSEVYINAARGQYCQIGVRITDTFNQITDLYYATRYMRARLPNLPSQELKISCVLEEGRVTVRPYTNKTPLAFSTIKATGDNGILYTVQIVIESKNFVLDLIKDEVGTNGDTIQFLMAAEEINQKLFHNNLKNNINDKTWNADYEVIYRIYVRDNFGNISSYNISPIASVRFIEIPYFIEGDQIKLGIGYLTSNNNIDTILFPSTTETIPKKINHSRMINQGEGIILNFPLGRDYNEDIVGYELWVKYLDERPSIENPDTSGGFTLLKTIGINEIKEASFGKYYEHKLSRLALSKFLIFRIVAVDSRGKKSKEIISNTYLVGGRTQSPSISLQKVIAQPEGNLKVSFQIPDIGGNKFVNSNIYKYFSTEEMDSYPNFERDIIINNKEFEKKPILILNICLDGDFSNTSPENFFSGSQDLSGPYIELSGTYNTIKMPEHFLGRKLYVRIGIGLSIGLSISTSSTRYIEGYSETLTYYPDSPTVSYREGAVGINISPDNKEDIVIVSDTLEKRFIRFVATGEDGAPREITIDLKTGQISGLVIDQGQW